MANKKPKKLATPLASPAASVEESKKGAILAQLLRPRVLSTFAFGLSGLLVGLATGLNHFPVIEQTTAIPKMMLLAAYLGDPHVDLVAGLLTGFTGLVMGACLGFSALSEPKDMGLSLLLSVLFASLAITFTGSVLIAGLGFLAGHSPVIMAYLKLRRA